MPASPLGFVLCVLVALFGVAGGIHAVASSTPAPTLEVRQSGQWYDPAFDGQGLVLSVFERGGVRRVNVLLFAGGEAFNTRPMWQFAAGPVSQAGALDLYQVYAAFGLPAQGVAPLQVGTISLTVERCDRIRADVSIDSVTAVTWHLQPLLFDAGAGC